MSAIGLYYPYVHFRDQAWVKAAALYMSRVARIVPPGFEVTDSDDVRALQDGLGFVYDLDPSAAVGVVSARLLDVVETHGSALHNRYRLGAFSSVIDAEPAPVSQSVNRVSRNLPSRDGVAGIFPQEMTEALREALQEQRLAVPVSRHFIEDGAPERGWVGVHPRLAWVFKCALTAELAERTQFMPLTDQAEAHTATGSWTSERMAEALLGEVQAGHAAEDMTVRVGVLSLCSVLPAGLRQVPVQKIIQLRERYESEFLAYVEAVEQTAQALRAKAEHITEPASLELHVQDAVRKDFEVKVRELRGAMQGLGLKTTVSAVSLKAEMPALITAGTGLLTASSTVTAVGTGAAVALGAFGLFTNHRYDRREIVAEQRAASFLLRAESGLRPKTLVRRIISSAGRGSRQEA